MAKRFLGCDIGAASILFVEAELNGASSRIVRTGEFVLDLAGGLKKTAETAAALKAFWRNNGFTARIACAGIPAPWLMLKEKTVPALSLENLSGLLRLQAERDFSLPPDELLLDYTLGEAAEGTQILLLAATPRERVLQLAEIFKMAGLKLAAVTSSSLALAAALSKFPMLALTPRGADLVLRTPAGLLKPAVVSAQSTASPSEASIAQIADETRRVLAMNAGADDPLACVWNGSAWTAEQLAELQALSGVRLKIAAVRDLDPGDALAAAPGFAAAAALAPLAAIAGGKQPRILNFVSSKLIEPRPPGFVVRRWMIAAVAALVLLAAGLGYSAWSDYREFSELKRQSVQRKEEMDGATAFLSRFASAQPWYDKRPNHLECMKALARVIPVDGSAWIVNLSVKDDSHCVVSFHAVDGSVYFEVLDKIEKDDAFKEVKMLYMTRPDKKKNEVSFAIGFVFSKPSSPAPMKAESASSSVR